MLSKGLQNTLQESEKGWNILHPKLHLVVRLGRLQLTDDAGCLRLLTELKDPVTKVLSPVVAQGAEDGLRLVLLALQDCIGVLLLVEADGGESLGHAICELVDPGHGSRLVLQAEDLVLAAAFLELADDVTIVEKSGIDGLLGSR